MPPIRSFRALRRVLAGVAPTAADPFLRRRLAGAVTATAVMSAIGTAGLLSPATVPGAARAQGTSGVVEFRWDDNKGYNKLYYFMTSTVRAQRSDYYLILRPKDRKTAILKLTITVPDYFDAKIDAKQIKLCRMSPGGITRRTRCEEKLPATIEVTPGGRAIEVFPDTPIPVNGTVGVMMTLFNPFTAGMFQFNALAQAPGDVPISGYLGSWLIEIVPN